MSSKPHSKTVRGTLDNPKTQEAMKSDKPTAGLGDATSLKPENGNKSVPSNDSAPPRGQGNDKDSDSAPTVSDPYRNNKDAGGPDKKAKGNGRDEGNGLPHSKTVRGTLANDDGKKVNNTQLGDPASLKAETSKSEMGKSTEREGGDKSGKSKL
ncbi:Nn.00g087600.m01.CDS01 [Neocucurbitaria sp. VM-36]